MFDFPYWNEASFIICAMLGGMMHYMKKFLRKETNVSMGKWFGRSNWMASIYTFIMFFFVLVGALAGGIINESTGFWAVLYTGFMTGFAVDAGFNSDKDITDQIVALKGQTKTLFKKDPDDISVTVVKKKTVVKTVTPPPDEETSDEQVDAPVEKPKASKPVPGSPKVPPKKIT